MEKAHSEERAFGFFWLFYVAWALLAIALASESFFRPTLFTGFQIERMALDFLNNIFLLDLALEPAERAFQGFTVLEYDLCQTDSPPSAW
jgi:hypothetical protein